MVKRLIFKLQLQGPDFSREIILKPGVTYVGREPGNEIQLPFPKVSRRHASFESLEAVCILQDLGSANGTLVDGVRIQPNVPTPINEGSRIEIDVVQISLTFEAVDDSAPAAEKKPDDTVSRAGQTDKQQEKPIKEPAPQVQEPAASGKSADEVKPEARKKAAAKKEITQPPQPPSEPPENPTLSLEPGAQEPESALVIPPGLSDRSIRLLEYLPGIYHTDFMSHFMALFESIWMPVEWNIDNFDLYLSPKTAPQKFLPWLSSWYDIVFNSSWTEEKRRLLLIEAPKIYARRGTRWALTRLLEIYTGETPRILEFEKEMEAHTFKVIIKKNAALDQELLTRMIDTNKPAHTSYELEIIK